MVNCDFAVRRGGERVPLAQSVALPKVEGRNVASCRLFFVPTFSTRNSPTRHTIVYP
jgi:hypothetical protein